MSPRNASAFFHRRCRGLHARRKPLSQRAPLVLGLVAFPCLSPPHYTRPHRCGCSFRRRVKQASSPPATQRNGNHGSANYCSEGGGGGHASIHLVARGPSNGTSIFASDHIRPLPARRRRHPFIFSKCINQSMHPRAFGKDLSIYRWVHRTELLGRPSAKSVFTNRLQECLLELRPGRDPRPEATQRVQERNRCLLGKTTRSTRCRPIVRSSRGIAGCLLACQPAS